MGEMVAVIQGWYGKNPGTIPHRVLIEAGIATEDELLWFRWRPGHCEWRTIWFRREQAAFIRSHPDFRATTRPERNE